MNKNTDKKLSSLQELSSLRSKITGVKKKPYKNTFPNPLILKGDGVDHINVWDAAVTELGKILSHSYKFEFHHTMFGKFKTMESFWFYVRSKERDDQIRSLSGRPLKEFVNNKLTICQITNFKAIVMDTHWQRIRSSQPLMDEIKNSTLRFDCYYVNANSQIPTRPTMYKWICLGLEEIRNAIKEDREPDFRFLLDVKNSGIYDFVHDHITNSVEQESSVPIEDNEQTENQNIEEEVKTDSN